MSTVRIKKYLMSPRRLFTPALFRKEGAAAAAGVLPRPQATVPTPALFRIVGATIARP